MAQNRGFDVYVHDRDARNQEKAVDTDLVARGTEAIFMAKRPGIVVVASGDRDFIPLIQVAARQGWITEMAAFNTAFSPYGEMATTVNKVRSLDAMFDRIGHHGFQWP
jgi:uncharacterized LabA/DUF88 family protein